MDHRGPVAQPERGREEMYDDGEENKYDADILGQAENIPNDEDEIPDPVPDITGINRATAMREGEDEDPEGFMNALFGAEIRSSDSGLNLKLYAAGLRLIYYLVRFCHTGSIHSVIGQLGVSAYTFYDYNRALASVRVGLRRISPVFRQSEDEVVHRTAATMVQEDVDTANEPIQLKFILYKYCLENWDDETKVSPRKDLKEAFARQVQTMFDTLPNLLKYSL
ncbi:hypothetical protein HPULCUR_011492 [Helicostylum pulchrum]|uniref:Uncharacterized protein n=1 Tax=Helicostylum pulchrum TaxID=562976 RepID=A0ABP9YG86_9FUNG